MIVATMASLHGREALLEQTVASLAPQVDAICIYLNGHDEVPRFLAQPKVLHAVLSKEAGWRGAEAKLWWWDRDLFKAAPSWDPDDVALIVDDDIVYPPNYAATMMAALQRRPGTAACVHGSVLDPVIHNYAGSRWIARAAGPLSDDARCHLPGTGTMAFRVGTWRPSLAAIEWSHCVDIAAGLQLRDAGIECWAAARTDGWLRPMLLPKGTSVFKQRVGAGNDAIETAILQRSPWPALEPFGRGWIRRGIPQPAASPWLRSIRPSLNAQLPPTASRMVGDRLKGRAGIVVELGSGHGSARLAADLPPTCRLVSVEHDGRFVGLVRDTQYIHAPIKGGWYDRTILQQRMPAPHEQCAIVVDGPPKHIGRSGLLANLDLFSDDAPMIVDDVHRPDDRELAEKLAQIRGQRMEIVDCGGRAFAALGWP